MSPKRYRKKAYVWADVAAGDGMVETPEGTMAFHAGDYLVTDSPATHVWPVKKAIFESTYEPVPDGVKLSREEGDGYAAVVEAHTIVELIG